MTIYVYNSYIVSFFYNGRCRYPTSPAYIKQTLRGVTSALCLHPLMLQIIAKRLICLTAAQVCDRETSLAQMRNRLDGSASFESEREAGGGVGCTNNFASHCSVRERQLIHLLPLAVSFTCGEPAHAHGKQPRTLRTSQKTLL